MNDSFKMLLKQCYSKGGGSATRKISIGLLLEGRGSKKYLKDGCLKKVIVFFRRGLLLGYRMQDKIMEIIKIATKKLQALSCIFLFSLCFQS